VERDTTVAQDFIALVAQEDGFHADQLLKRAAPVFGVVTERLRELLDTARGVPTETAPLFVPDEPWPDAVDGAALLTEVRATILRYVVCPPEVATAGALWIAHAHALDAADLSPIFLIISPTIRCGKSTLLKVIGGLSPRGLLSSNVTAAAVFRVVEQDRPTLLVDEADTFLGVRDEVRGLLNAGHDRQTAFVLRTAGDEHKPCRFSTWAAKVLAQVGRPHTSLVDRALVATMRRRRGDEPVSKFRLRDRPQLEPLRRQLARWAADTLDALRAADPEVPEELNDRASDNWTPLLAIAEAVGGEEWPALARRAALMLSGDDSTVVAEDDGILLLEDLRSLFAERTFDGQERHAIRTPVLLSLLHDLEDRPWAHYGSRQQALTSAQLAGLLRPFGVRSAQIKVFNGKGYRRAALFDAWRRYLSPAPGLRMSTPPPEPETAGTRQ
jgi:putative DNA primase/helicase